MTSSSLAILSKRLPSSSPRWSRTTRAASDVLQPLRAQLQQQALAQIARADAGRVELVDALQRALDHLEVLAALEGDLLDLQLQVAVLVHVADQQRGDRLLLLVERVHLQLPDEVLGERLWRAPACSPGWGASRRRSRPASPTRRASRCCSWSR